MVYQKIQRGQSAQAERIEGGIGLSKDSTGANAILGGGQFMVLQINGADSLIIGGKSKTFGAQLEVPKEVIEKLCKKYTINPLDVLICNDWDNPKFDVKTLLADSEILQLGKIVSIPSGEVFGKYSIDTDATNRAQIMTQLKSYLGGDNQGLAYFFNRYNDREVTEMTNHGALQENEITFSQIVGIHSSIPTRDNTVLNGGAQFVVIQHTAEVYVFVGGFSLSRGSIQTTRPQLETFFHDQYPNAKVVYSGAK